MAITYRLAQTKDLAGLQALYQELRPQDPPLRPDAAQRTLQRLLDNPAIRLVVTADGEQPIATCMLAMVPGLVHQTQPFGIIEHVVTAPPYRGQGIALAMLEYTLQLAWRKGCYKVMLLSGQQRTGAHQLYLRAGFDGDRERGFVIRRPEGR
ncbi:GNAT family N-acetyltransferase [Serratia plymuthica]|uniref:GNAT family N-acetyltransferase n=1 Tax=Serratia plymuthica TaxID=82996 RepID=UPI0018D79260|nr:GNAT family N-acetyltransferase [Serratia plymuthica]QPS54762.1 GNAT family N-acetyltransferase [Serratia plymuthica]CAI1622444.1 Predicted acetyltransferase involved in intracellular survival and related acetyltransferases [Serratia plymuthica]